MNRLDNQQNGEFGLGEGQFYSPIDSLPHRFEPKVELAEEMRHVTEGRCTANNHEPAPVHGSV